MSFVADYLDRPDVSMESFDSENGLQRNLLFRAGGDPDDAGDDANGLMLAAHIDVVPAVEPDWTSDPFTLTERDGRLFGRGACDMKGFLALAMNHLAAIDVRALDRPLILLVTYDEELGSLGAQRLARQWPRDRPLPAQVIVGEPTSLRAVRMTKGHLKLRAVIRGRAAHSGFPHQGVNAIERASEAVRALASLRAAMEQRRVPTSEFFPDTPYPTLNIGQIRGGDAVNVIPGECELLIGLRLLPGMSSDEAVAEALAALEHAVGAEHIALSTINDSPPMLLHMDAPVYRTMCEALRQSESYGVPFSSDGGVLSRDLGLECVLWGPGSIDVAHRADEYLPRAELDRADELLGSIIKRFLFESQP